jgi:hypothetical protein
MDEFDKFLSTVQTLQKIGESEKERIKAEKLARDKVAARLKKSYERKKLRKQNDTDDTKTV